MYIHFYGDQVFVKRDWNENLYVGLYFSIIYTNVPWHELDLNDENSYTPLFTTHTMLPYRLVKFLAKTYGYAKLVFIVWLVYTLITSLLTVILWFTYLWV